MQFDNHLKYHGNLDWLEKSTILLVRHGSHAYGTNTPTSDVDIKGVAIPPKQYLFGFTDHFDQADKGFDSDAAIYNIRKFFELATNCNPNIMELLWIDPSDILYADRLGEWLISLRQDFLSAKARHSFAGYAASQLKRIRTHQRWLKNPPTHKPTREEYGLPLTSVVDDEQMKAADFLTEQGYGWGTNFQDLVSREKKYRIALKDWTSYENWKETRNRDRFSLEAKFGYDTKHAMHLVRLLRMCEEILVSGKLIVKRPDAEELLAIRNGAWTLDQLIEWADQQDGRMEELYQKTTLPHSPDRAYLDGQCIRIIERYHNFDHGGCI
jgi:predicted nucleotidyltransferase